MAGRRRLVTTGRSLRGFARRDSGHSASAPGSLTPEMQRRGSDKLLSADDEDESTEDDEVVPEAVRSSRLHSSIQLPEIRFQAPTDVDEDPGSSASAEEGPQALAAQSFGDGADEAGATNRAGPLEPDSVQPLQLLEATGLEYDPLTDSGATSRTDSTGDLDLSEFASLLATDRPSVTLDELMRRATSGSSGTDRSLHEHAVMAVPPSMVGPSSSVSSDYLVSDDNDGFGGSGGGSGSEHDLPGAAATPGREPNADLDEKSRAMLQALHRDSLPDAGIEAHPLSRGGGLQDHAEEAGGEPDGGDAGNFQRRRSTPAWIRAQHGSKDRVASEGTEDLSIPAFAFPMTTEASIDSYLQGEATQLAKPNGGTPPPATPGEQQQAHGDKQLLLEGRVKPPGEADAGGLQHAASHEGDSSVYNSADGGGGDEATVASNSKSLEGMSLEGLKSRVVDTEARLKQARHLIADQNHALARLGRALVEEKAARLEAVLRCSSIEVASAAAVAVLDAQLTALQDKYMALVECTTPTRDECQRKRISFAPLPRPDASPQNESYVGTNGAGAGQPHHRTGDESAPHSRHGPDS